MSDLFYHDDPNQVIITTAMEHMANYLSYISRFKTAVVGVSPREAYRQYVNVKTPGIVRISLNMYNTFKEIDQFIDALKNI